MKFFSIVLSLCLHLIVILLLVHFIGVSQKHVSKEEKLYKVSLVSLQEKKARKIAYVKRGPRKKTKSIPKEATKKKEIAAKTVPEKSEKKKKPASLPEKVLEEVREKRHFKKINEMREKELEGKMAAITRKIKEEEKEQEKIENEKKRQEEYDNYEEKLNGFIKLSLNPAFIEKQNLKTTVEVVIDNNGEIIKATMEESSGNVYFDKMVMDAVSRFDPLPKPPANLLIGNYLDMKLEFNPEKYEELHN